MALRWEAKRPTEVRDYQIDWSTFLGADTIASQVTVASGITINAQTINGDNKGITFWLAGGTAGTIATLTNTIVTANGRTEVEVITLPIVAQAEPVSLTQAKEQLRVLDDFEDAYIASLIAPARRFVENLSGIVMVQRQFTEQHIPKCGSIRLYKRPIVSVDPVAYIDGDELAATYAGARFSTGVLYPALGETWPTAYAGEAFTVTYTAGLSATDLATDEWAPLVHAMKLLIGQWFEAREAGGEKVAEAPFAVTALCDQYRQVLV